jgi:tetratricopeptide (TPR) repeat protein
VTAKENDNTQQIENLLLKAEEMLKADPSKAIYYSNSAIAEAQKSGNESYVTMAQAILGEAYMNQGDFNMGFEVLTNAMEICPIDCLHIQAHVFLHLSGAYLKLKDLNQATTFVDKATNIYKALNDSLNLAHCYNARGLVYIQIPDNKRAEENFKEALAINRKMNNIKSVAANLNNLCLYEGNAQEKISMLHEAIRLNNSLGNIWSLGENYNNLGTQYYYAHDYDKSLATLDTAMNYSKQINAKELISDNYRYKSWVYEAKKDYEKAYQNLFLLYETEKELLTMNEMKQIELNIIQKRLHDKEQQIIMQEQAFQIRNLRLWIYISVLIVIALFLALSYSIYYYRHKKKIQLLEASQQLKHQEKELMELKLKQTEHEAQNTQIELEHNRKELTNLAFFIRSRNKLLAQIQAKLKEGYKLSGSEAERHIRSINAYISQFNTQNTDTELLIDKINRQFIQKLSRLHPNLSKNEQRLASLLRIGLSTKEIASIINSSPKTVNMARYRLRKHLNLECDDSLTEYMNNIQ